MITGVAAGTTSVTAKATYGTKTVSKKIAVTVKEEEPAVYTLDMTSLEVTAADTLVAKFASAVKTDNTTLTLKRGTTSVAFKETWNADCTEVTIKTDAKMAAGTYELTAADKTDATVTSSKTATVEAQKAKEIKILNTTALTDERTGVAGVPGGKLDNGTVYVYYDVLDQYGESMRTSVSIDWSSSAEIASKNVTEGRLTLVRSDNKDFTYGEQIFITGVNSKTGLSASATLTVGAKQAIDSVVMAGFIKSGTTDILTSLPKDFKSSAYYMLFNALDQNGNNIDANKTQTTMKDSITFVSDTPLVIKEIATGGKVVTIKDTEYATVLVTPGIKVEQGGEVNVTAIANKTGKKTVLNVPVNVSEILQSFEIGAPVDIIADGETREISFTAKDTKGNEIKNFETIAKLATFNKLQFSASEGNLILSQKDDGTAKLEYADKDLAWSDSQTTDGIDRMVSLTAIVVGGDTNNQMISISDKARPTGVSNVKLASAYVEGATETLALTKYDATTTTNDANKDNAYIEYVDQYGRKLDENKAQEFFLASTNGNALHGNDFNGYVFGTMVTYTGSDNKSTLTGASTLVSTSNKDVFLYAATSKNTNTITMGKDVLGAASGEGCKFAVTKIKKDDLTAGKTTYVALDRTKNFDYSVVDIEKVQNLAVKDIPKLYIETKNSQKEFYADADTVDLGTPAFRSKGSAGNGLTGTYADDYNKTEVVVTGTYAGKEVKGIDKKYVSFTSDKFGLRTTDGNKNYINDVVTAPAISDLYNVTSSKTNVPRKDAEDLLRVTVQEVYSNVVSGSAIVGTEIAGNTAGIVAEKTELTVPVKISDAFPEGTTLVANAETTTLHPEQTNIIVKKDSKLDDDSSKKEIFTLLDQYGKKFVGMTFTVKDVVDKEDYADNNFATKDNSTSELKINGAERTNTFTLVASYKKLSASVKVTVGADKNAKIDKNGNHYLDTLIGTYTSGANNLETQRQDGLK